jgi:hypothetical protein
MPARCWRSSQNFLLRHYRPSEKIIELTIEFKVLLSWHKTTAKLISQT